MQTAEPQLRRRLIDPDLALRTIAEGTAAAIGEGFFRALVQNLARALDAYGAWVTEYLPQRRTLRGLAFWMGGQWHEDYQTVVDGTPCEAVIDGRRLVHIPDRIVELYPNDPELRDLGAVSYLGVPFIDAEGAILGHLAVLDNRPLEPDPRLMAVFRIFAARAAAEHQRLAAEARVREREEKLGRLIDSALDGIVDLDGDLRITVANAAAERIFGCPGGQLIGRPFAELLTSGSARRLFELIDGLGGEAGRTGALWVPGTLEARRGDGRPFAAEATVSRYEMRGRPCHTIILRDIAERVEAQKTIQYLQDELRSLRNSDQIIGASPGLGQVLRDIEQVAATDATVLILGETGTGKELIARSIHARSRRHAKPLVRVNCAAIPASLMESEFFGHEKGAFTGATQRREGRFALADGGTLFLDEVGELPIDLQSKLLRVLQEGELEPVGGSRTIKVDVRVIAATNRDLTVAIREGKFREDLYYRLNVFPISVPPLRQRIEDIALLAPAFVERAAQRAGRHVEPLSEQCLRRLMRYSWPGNIRELENVIERAVITSTDGRLNLDRALPETAEQRGGMPATAAAPTPALEQPVAAGHSQEPTHIHTVAELEELERRNILRAVEASGGRISGVGGAAERLGMKPSTLRSRMKALGVKNGTTW